MFLEIITPDKKIFEGEVNFVQLPGSSGLFTILKSHAPIISSLDEGTIRVEDVAGKEYLFEVKGGVVENAANTVIVLVESV